MSPSTTAVDLIYPDLFINNFSVFEILGHNSIFTGGICPYKTTLHQFPTAPGYQTSSLQENGIITVIADVDAPLDARLMGRVPMSVPQSNFVPYIAFMRAPKQLRPIISLIYISVVIEDGILMHKLCHNALRPVQ